MAADVVGFSRLMGADETATLSVLRRIRTEVLGPTIAGNRGKLVKSMGDGWLVEFQSAVDAVNCAMQVQDRMVAHEKIEVRIGVHIGDVVHEDDDIFGDGVNVAARLQEIAEPGGVTVSDLVYGTLDGTLRPSFDDRGERRLKNIERPIRTWGRAPSVANRADSGLAGPAALRRAGFPEVAIQPVMTSDERAEVRELADALTSDLHAYLGSVRWLLAETTDRIPSDAYSLRASVRGRDDRIRLEARLFAPGGEQLWLGKFDGSLASSFEWQDQVGEEVVAHLLGLIMDSEHRKISGLTPDEMTAEQCLLRAMMSRRSATLQGYVEALAHCSKALEKDPQLIEAFAEAIFTAISVGTLGHRKLAASYSDACAGWIESARPWAAHSAALEAAIALADCRKTGNAAAMRAKANDVLRRAPFDVRALFFCGWGLLHVGDAQLALDCFKKHQRMGRFDAYAISASAGAALASIQIGDDEAAIRHASKGLEITEGFAVLYRALAAAYGLSGRADDAKNARASLLELVPEDSISRVRALYHADTPGIRRYIEGLRTAGLPD